MNTIKNILTRVIQNRVLQHLLFWVVSFVSLLYLFKLEEDIVQLDVIYTLLFHISLIFGVFVNIGILIPFFLKKERYVLYIFLLVLLWGTVAKLNEFTFNTLSDILLPDYFFVSEYSFSQLLIFSFVYLALSTLLKLSKSWFFINEMQKKMIILQQEQAEAELKALKGNINPHFFVQ